MLLVQLIPGGLVKYISMAVALACALLTPGSGVCSKGAGVHASPETLKNFHHKAWTLDDGIGSVFSVKQAPNGFIWLTTSKGIFRFDGVRFESVDDVTNQQIHNSTLENLFVSASGSLWFASRNKGLLLWKDNHVTVFPDRLCTPTIKADTMVEDASGTLWIRSSRGVFRLRQGKCEAVAAGPVTWKGQPHAVLMGTDQTLWVKGAGGGAYFLRKGEASFRLSPYGAGDVGQFAYLKNGPDGSVWLSDDSGLRRISGDPAKGIRTAKSRVLKPAQFGNFTFASDGSLWAASNHGVHHFKDLAKYGLDEPLDPLDAEVFGVKQGLTSEAIWDLMMDQEGDLWVATSSGLDQLRPSQFSTISIPFGAARELAVAAGDHDSVWVGSESVPLSQVFRDGHIQSYPKTVSSIAVRNDRNGTIWSSTWKSRKLWKFDKGALSTIPLPSSDNDEAAADIAVDKNNDIWLSTFNPDSYRRVGNDWVKITALLGRKAGVIGAMSGDEAGNVWFAFSNKLVEWNGQSLQRYGFDDGSYNISVNVVSVHGDHVWMGGSGGVLLFSQGKFHLLNRKHEGVFGVTGIVETAEGELWMNGPAGIARIDPDELRKWIKDPAYIVEDERFGAVDGLPGTAAERWPEPSAIQSGKLLWFASTAGVAFIDPLEFGKNRNKTPPQVYIKSATSDGKTYLHFGPGPSLPSGRSLVFDYTALGFAVPERVMFRYRLNGLDTEWQNAGTRRQAYYTNLSPGKYVFHVLACNSEGVWNAVGDEYRFEILPAFYQTRWFWALCALASALTLWALVTLRIRHVSRAIRARAEERAVERARVARDLHDTLLQGVQGLILRVSVAAQQVPAEHKARTLLEAALTTADDVLLEGRSRIANLREQNQFDLGDALRNVGKDLNWQHEITFTVHSEGTPLLLQTDVQEELYFVGREAITNAFRHAKPTSIEVILDYGLKRFELSCSDDGVGIASKNPPADGATTHYGLIGMQERAERIGATWQQSSSPSGGTRIALVVPAHRAYRQGVVQRSGAIVRNMLRQRD